MIGQRSGRKLQGTPFFVEIETPFSGLVGLFLGRHRHASRELAEDFLQAIDRAGAADRASVAVRMVIVPMERQKCAYAGLFEAHGYAQSGFRMFLNQGFQLGIDIGFEGENHGLSGKTRLDRGTAYTVEVRFDGRAVTLLVNDGVEAEKVAPPIAPFEGEFTIGRARGEDYDFNGIIGDVSVFAIKP